MARANDDVERILLEFSDLLSILTEDTHKPRAYEKAARSVGGYHADLSQLDLKGILAIPNVGKSIAEKIVEALDTGTFADLEALRAQIPPGVRELMSIPGLGPKKAMVLYRSWASRPSRSWSPRSTTSGSPGSRGSGARRRRTSSAGSQQLSDSGGRVQVNVALDVAEALLDELVGARPGASCGVRGFAPPDAGDDRRCRPAGRERRTPQPIMDAFVGLPSASRVIANGDTKSSILTDQGLQVDLRVVPKEVWGAAMIYFTGSKAHNVRIREMAVRAGLKLNEYGLFDAKSGRAARRRDGGAGLRASRVAVHRADAAGGSRRGRGGARRRAAEGPAAQGPPRATCTRIPNLTDGLAPLEEMLSTAATLGYAYYAVTDHAPNLAMQRMTDEKILAQREQLRGTAGRARDDPAARHRAQHRPGRQRRLAGRSSWPGFDLTVASVHSHFTQSREEMTQRMIRAMENPYVNVIGHPTARKIGKRPPDRPRPRGGLRGRGADRYRARRSTRSPIDST